MARRTLMNPADLRRSLRMLAVVVAAAVMGVVLPASVPADAPVDLRAGARDRAIADIERALAAGDPVTLDWKAMAALDYNTGNMPESLKKLDGVVVRIPGFMVPLEDMETRVTEFLLVPYFGACIHTPPPPPNQMVHVLMERNQTIDVNLWDPIWVVGKLNIENVESPYGVVGFQATGERIQPYDG